MNTEELLELAKAADRDGRSAAAFECWRRVIDRHPERAGLKYRAILSLMKIGRISDAELLLNAIREERAPEPWMIELATARLCFAKFKLKEAEEHFRNAVALGPKSTAPAVFFVSFLKQSERFAEAMEVLMGALNADDELSEVYLNLGLVKRAMGEYDTARSYLLKALQIDPGYSDAKTVLSDVELCLNVNDGR